MPNLKLVFAAALSGLLFASCGGREPTAAENEAGQAETDALENAGPSGPKQVNGSEESGADSVPPPDAVSHPDGYLPDAADPREPSAPEPPDVPPASREPPPATEDEYIRNKQRP